MGVDHAVNVTEGKVVADKKFLQETNFAEESEAFKSDAIDNFEKHYDPDQVRADIKLARLANYKKWEAEDRAYLNDPSY